MLNNIEWLILTLLILSIFIIIILKVKKKEKMLTNQLNSLNELVDTITRGNSITPSYTEGYDSQIATKLYQYLLAREKKDSINLREKEELHSMISDITHQITTPVTNILLYTQLMSEIKVDEPISTYMEELMHQAGKIDFLVDALRKLSHLETDILRMNCTYHSIRDIIHNAIQQELPHAEKKRIAITLTGPDSTCYCDFKWTIEAIGNVINNSIKYSKEDSLINIDVSPGETFLHIKVTDEGMGILQEEIPHIFKRFYRSTFVSNEEGVGIGLYLVREIILAQGGYVYVESKYEIGTSFSIYLRNTSNISKL